MLCWMFGCAFSCWCVFDVCVGLLLLVVAHVCCVCVVLCLFVLLCLCCCVCWCCLCAVRMLLLLCVVDVVVYSDLHRCCRSLLAVFPFVPRVLELMSSA